MNSFQLSAIQQQSKVWQQAKNHAFELETAMNAHLNSCNAENKTGISICCAKIVIDLQKARDRVDTVWNELYRLSTQIIDPSPTPVNSTAASEELQSPA